METIDKINILNASILAMHQSIEKLKPCPEHIIVDGNRFKPFRNIPYECITKGDDKYLSIAAASILAKAHRDEYMKNFRCITGRKTKVILLKNIVKPSGNME